MIMNSSGVQQKWFAWEFCYQSLLFKSRGQDTLKTVEVGQLLFLQNHCNIVNV